MPCHVWRKGFGANGGTEGVGLQLADCLTRFRNDGGGVRVGARSVMAFVSELNTRLFQQPGLAGLKARRGGRDIGDGRNMVPVDTVADA